MCKHSAPLLALGALLVALTACGGADGLTPVIGLPPTIASISPSQGPASGGATVSVTGTNFTSLIVVSIGGNLCLSVNVSSSTALTCVTPPGSAGARDVQVSTATGSDTLTGGYLYVASVLRLAPGSQPVIDVTALNADRAPVSILLDILNFESQPDVFVGDVPFSALESLANGTFSGSIQEVGGFYFGLEPQSGVVFWYEDLSDLALGEFPDGWCLDTRSDGAMTLEVTER